MSDAAETTDDGNSLHTRAPASPKARSPTVRSRVRGAISWCVVADRIVSHRESYRSCMTSQHSNAEPCNSHGRHFRRSARLSVRLSRTGIKTTQADLNIYKFIVMTLIEHGGMAGTLRLVGDSGDCRCDDHHLGIFVPTTSTSCIGNTFYSSIY